MAIEKTLSIIKPNAIDHIGHIYDCFKEIGLQVIAAKMQRLTPEQAEHFYAIHSDQPFFRPLVEFMSSGRVMVQVLEGENAVRRYRDLMGATDPKKAMPGTLRANATLASSMMENAVHGSDSVQNAHAEIAFFFSTQELHI
jgi:nucleoside-diphosphate kinase